MDTNQIAQLNEEINKIQRLDLNAIVAAAIKNDNLEHEKIVSFTPSEYTNTIARLVEQLKAALDSIGLFLPLNYDYPDFGAGNIHNDLFALLDNLRRGDLRSLRRSTRHVGVLVYYQISNGFWDKPEANIRHVDEIAIGELSNKLDLMAKKLEGNRKLSDKLIEQVQISERELNGLIETKKRELQQIDNSIVNARDHVDEINRLLNSSTATNEKISSLFDHEYEQHKKQEQYFKEQSAEFKKLERSLSESQTRFTKQIEEFDEKLNFVEGKRKFFDERNTYLEELIGREVGASLFETFKQRKEELDKPVSRWLLIVIGMAILTFFAILVIFTNVFGYLGDVPTEISVVRLITNSLKTLPFFFLLFYSISQYNKERTFQEEYAFKSSVALTIKAYADIIQNEEVKDELITESVSEVFKSPIANKNVRHKEDNSILDTAKDLLKTALDVLQKR